MGIFRLTTPYHKVFYDKNDFDYMFPLITHVLHSCYATVCILSFFNPIMVDNYASYFNCRRWVGHQTMMTPT